MENRDEIIKQTVVRLQAIQTIDEFIAAREEIIDLMEKFYISAIEVLKAFFEDMFSMTPEEQQTKSLEFQDESYLINPKIMQEFERLDSLFGDHEYADYFSAEMEKRIGPYLEEATEQLGKLMGTFMGDLTGGMTEAMGTEKVEDEIAALPDAADAAGKIQKEIKDQLAAKMTEINDKMAKMKKGT